MGKKLPDKIYKAMIITLSDRAFRGEYQDRSGPEIESYLHSFFEENAMQYRINRTIIPDEEEALVREMEKALSGEVDFVFTSGGTGIGPRDITPEVVESFILKEIPGIMDLIRIKYGLLKPNAVISRSVAGLHNNTFIYTLPGSVKAVQEYMTEILKIQKHLIFMLYGIDAHGDIEHSKSENIFSKKK
jgi:molybdenum cofactor synthesis domain-containing protein